MKLDDKLRIEVGLASTSDLKRLRNRLYSKKDQQSMLALEPWRAKQLALTNRWLAKKRLRSLSLRDSDGNLLGCLSAFHDPQDPLSGRIGFYECIDDDQAANALLDAAILWLRSEGVKEVIGPANAGERHELWGLRVEANKVLPFGMNHSKKYYQQQWKNSAFSESYTQYVYRRMVEKALPEVFERISRKLMRSAEFQIEHFHQKEASKYISAFVEIYNSAWKEIRSEELSIEEGQEMFEELKAVLDSKLLWFCFHNSSPVAFFLAIPDLNSFGFDWSSRLNIFSKIRLFLRLKFLRPNKINGLLFGIKPSYRNKGIPAALVLKMQEENRKRYSEIRLNWIGSFNEPMQKLVEKMGFEKYSSLITYKRNLD